MTITATPQLSPTHVSGDVAGAPPHRLGPPAVLIGLKRALLLAVLPELTAGLLLLGLVRARVRAGQPGRDRGSAAEWVLITAISMAIAVTVGTIIYNKIKAKATGISTDTPAPGQ